MVQENNDIEPSRFKVCVARFIDIGVVSFVVLSLVSRLGIEIRFSIYNIPDSRIGESILGQLFFLAIGLIVWLIYWLGSVRLATKTIGMVCARIAIFDSEGTKKASIKQLLKRMKSTWHRLMLAIPIALRMFGVEAIFPVATFIIFWAYISDPRNLKDVCVDQESGTKMVRSSTSFSLENRLLIWGMSTLGSILSWIIIIGMLLGSALWLWAQPLQERQYRNRTLVLEDRLEQICQSPSIAEYCR